MDVSKLIEELESATAPSVRLSGKIRTALSISLAKDFTHSIDAALTLVPKGWDAILYTETRVAELYPVEGVKRPAGIQARGWHGRTLAINICIAALKARQVITTASAA